MDISAIFDTKMKAIRETNAALVDEQDKKAIAEQFQQAQENNHSEKRESKRDAAYELNRHYEVIAENTLRDAGFAKGQANNAHFLDVCNLTLFDFVVLTRCYNIAYGGSFDSFLDFIESKVDHKNDPRISVRVQAELSELWGLK